VTEFEKVWLITRLARRAATILAMGLLLLALAWSTTAVLLMVDTKIASFLPDANLGFLTRAQWLPLGCLALAAGLGLIALYSEPRTLDRQLQVRDHAREDDPIGEAKLTAAQADAINRALRRLQAYCDGWYEAGQVDNRATVFWSPVMQQNACTYGGAGDTVRVVYSGDLLCTSLIAWGEEEPPAWLGNSMAEDDLAAILAHELGHVHHKDFVSAVFIAQLIKILTWIFLPFVLIDRILAGIGRFLRLLPFGGILNLVFTLVARLPVLVVLSLLHTGQLADSLQGQLREYVADTYAVKLMGEADSLVTAMMKLADLQLAFARTRKVDRKTARWDRYSTAIALGKEDRPSGTIAAVLRFFATVGSSHPPMLARLERLGRLGFMVAPDDGEAAGSRRAA